MIDLRAFRKGLTPYVKDPHARPFVCTGSPLECKSFVVGLNAATRLTGSFASYWSDVTGFDRQKFDSDYNTDKPKKGNRPRIEAIARELMPCLETNLYAVPTKKAKQLTAEDRLNPAICYLFKSIRPSRVFVHSNEPIRFFKEKTGCSDFLFEPKRVLWDDHEFWLLGRPGPLFTSRVKDVAECGATLAACPAI